MTPKRHGGAGPGNPAGIFCTRKQGPSCAGDLVMAQMVTRPVPHGSAEFRFPAVTPPPRCPTGAPVCRPPPPGPLSLVIQPPTRHPAEPGSRRDSGRTDAAPAPTSSVLRGKPSPQVTTISDGGGSLAEDPQGGTAQSGAISSVVGKGHR